MTSATSAVHPVWWAAPSPVPMSAGKYSRNCRSGLVMRERVPRVAVLAVVLTHGAPGPLGRGGTPLVPGVGVEQVVLRPSGRLSEATVLGRSGLLTRLHGNPYVRGHHAVHVGCRAGPGAEGSPQGCQVCSHSQRPSARWPAGRDYRTTSRPGNPCDPQSFCRQVFTTPGSSPGLWTLRDPPVGPQDARRRQGSTELHPRGIDGSSRGAPPGA